MSKSDSKKDLKELKDEEIPLNVILKFIKPFDGSREKLNAFIVNCDNAISLSSSSQEDITFKFIISQLDGKAQSACCIKDFDNWSSLKEFLKNQFGERKHYAHLLTELQECHQTNQETVSQFHLRVETCLSKLLTEVTISNTKKSELVGRVAAMEDLALHTFNIGLHPRIANIVRCRDPKNLNEAVNYAISEEKIQQHTFRQNVNSRKENNRPPPKPLLPNNNNQPSSFRDSSVCRYCKKEGHTLAECKLREFNNKKYNNKFNYPAQQHSSKPKNPHVNFVNNEEDSITNIFESDQNTLNY